MTTVQLAQIVSRFLNVPDLTGLESAQALELITAINSGVQTFFAEAPDSYSRTTISHRVRTPDTLELGMTANSNQIDAEDFLDSHRGCSVVIEGDEQINEVTGNDLLLHDYLGTTGTQSATLWYDAIPITDFLILQILNEPLVVQTGKVLKYHEQNDLATLHNPRHQSPSDYPEKYTVEHVGGSLDADIDAVFQSRFIPRPVVSFTLKFDAHVLPITYDISHLETATRIPIANSLVPSLLVPLIEGELANSTLFDTSFEPRAAELKAERARQKISELPPHFVRTKSKLRTRRGF